MITHLEEVMLTFAHECQCIILNLICKPYSLLYHLFILRVFGRDNKPRKEVYPSGRLQRDGIYCRDEKSQNRSIGICAQDGGSRRQLRVQQRPALIQVEEKELPNMIQHSWSIVQLFSSPIRTKWFK